MPVTSALPETFVFDHKLDAADPGRYGEGVVLQLYGLERPPTRTANNVYDEFSCSIISIGTSVPEHAVFFQFFFCRLIEFRVLFATQLRNTFKYFII